MTHLCFVNKHLDQQITLLDNLYIPNLGHRSTLVLSQFIFMSPNRYCPVSKADKSPL
jgi:hypothetical protein